jgi:Tol biopolymer transport system component
MALAAGTRLGSYEITGSLGAGGMGEVYRATDTTLEREVAIKVLPQSVASDESRIARFEQEAKTLAALNHPNIGQIYGLERSDGTTALVMELVEGPTLADRISAGPVPPDEAILIAQQIADALEAAHEQQIVHRDLKPANIKLKSDAVVKVLDFGIAKVLEPRAGISGPQAPSLTTPAMTQAGILLGTAAYMAPEQARGKDVDQRADIWAFGCVLYEMLTGQPAFLGEDVAITLARVLANDTDLKSMPDTISPAVRQTIKLCLEKDVRKRIADIRDVKLALKGSFETDSPAAVANARVARSFWRRAIPIAAAALMLGVVAAGLAMWTVLRPDAPNVARFDVTPDDLNVLLASPPMVVAPDGQSIAYAAGGDGAGAASLRLRRLDQLDSTTLIDDPEGRIASPFFSPDGAQVGFVTLATSTLKRVSTLGGAAATIAKLPNTMTGASWGSDGTIVFGTRGGGLWRVRAAGGEPERLTMPEGVDHAWPEIVPGNQAVLFTISRSLEEASKIAVLSLTMGEQRVLLQDGSAPHYSPTGHLIFARAGTQFAVGFDAASLKILGEPVPVQEGVAATVSQVADTSFSASGTLVYRARGNVGASERRLLWVDASGHETPVPVPPRAYDQVILSPDGTHAALRQEGDDSIWISDLTRGTLERLPASGEQPTVLFFSADGQRIASSVIRDGRRTIVWQAIDGAGAAEVLVTFDESVARISSAALSPDGTQFAPAVGHEGVDLGVVTIGDPNSYRDFLRTPAQEFGASISPDGHWIAYSSNDTGQYQVYVQRYPEGGGRLAVSTDPAVWPHWSAANALIYEGIGDGEPQNGTMLRVSVAGLGAPAGSLTFGSPTKLFPFRYFIVTNGESQWDMTADGERFLMISPDAQTDETSRLILVQNWSEELKRLAPTK